MTAWYTDDPDAQRFYELTDHSVTLLQPGDLIPRVGRLIAVTDVTRNKRTGARTITFDDAPDMDIDPNDPRPIPDTTIYRPRGGF